ncbi:large conductance mechanosensitive channel [Lacrimispora xylanisolvens]|uniref:Large-conductance mechanosensitive channel n=1 Tax=Lacrimispora xylanisolvens TaxID=384636 RepID=A0A2S6HRT4_9FIRM|nr:large conductance mechanosensitive channel [Hungatella xylanolytica]
MNNKKSITAEFKEFVLRGNVVDLAVGVIIGGAFQGIVSSLVKDVISPFIGVITGGVDFSNQFLLLYKVPQGTVIQTLADAQARGPVFAYGAFITSVINFLIMAVVIFLIIKAINVLRGTKQAGGSAAAEDKKCPFCYQPVDPKATRCPHCTSQLNSKSQTS